MKRIPDHERYKKPFDYKSPFIFALFVLFLIAIVYFDRRMEREHDDNVKRWRVFADALFVETTQEEFKKQNGIK